MGAAALTWAAGLLVGFLLTAVFLLRQQLKASRSELVRLGAVTAHQDARLFMLEQEQRWLASQVRHRGEEEKQSR